MRNRLETSTRRRTPLIASMIASTLTFAPAAVAKDWVPPPAGARSGTLKVAQFSTTRPDKVLADWSKPTRGVTVRTEHQIRLGKPITTFVIFRGCKADPQGKCRVQAELDVLSPSGQRSVTTKFDVWTGAAPDPSHVQISRQSATLRFDTPDKPGSYLLRTTVTDHVAGATLRTQERLRVLPR
jgi:hypothetical protein